MKHEQRVFVLDGDRFDDLESFYDEVSRELMGGLAYRYKTEPGKTVIPLDETYWGRNLDAFDDILHGDMGRIPVGTLPFTIVWRNSALSRDALGMVFDQLVAIIRGHPNITLRLE